jgi:hypothetical protein
MRPHQIEGVKFMYSCVSGIKADHIKGCILAVKKKKKYFSKKNSLFSFLIYFK